MFGSHLSIAGSMCNALIEGEKLGLDTVQVFTKNQQQWKAPPLDPGGVRDWKAHVARLGWQDRTVSHASYLINLASKDDTLWARSVDLMIDEIDRCDALGIPFLVHHPGSFVGWDLQSGLARIAAAYVELFKRTKGSRVVSCLEGTAGAGSSIGGAFEHLAELRARIIDGTGEPARVGFCLDTCHMHAAGYDMSTRDGADAAFAAFDRTCGLAHLRVMHINDSKGKAGSHLDRHDHIGEGTIGGGRVSHSDKGVFSPSKLKRSGFASVVNHPALRDIPKILETPKGLAPSATRGKQGPAYDTVNLRRLRSLVESGPARPAGTVPASQPKAAARPAARGRNARKG